MNSPNPATSVGSAIVPIPRVSVSVRAAVPGAGDVSFIDQLQKMHSHMVGWFPTKQIEGHIAKGNVLIAEDISDEATERRSDGGEVHSANASEASGDSLRRSVASSLRRSQPVGYCIAQDQYMKRDDVGIIYQLNVLPLKQRNLIGAALIKATFEKAAYGCKLFCCWCAQDIQANWFWESIGFVPLAFRTGSRAKQRVHIFWQRRVRRGANGEPGETTPYWFPSQTGAGAVREDRLVLPIPPGTHWRDAKPILLPGLAEPEPEMPKTLPGGAPVRTRPDQPKISTAHKMAIVRSQSKHLKGLPPGKAAIVSGGGIRYIERGDYEPEVEPPKPKRERPPKPRAKNDPKLIAAARELRDRYLEQINTPGGQFLPPGAQGKYDVSRQLAPGAAPFPGAELKQTPLLKAA